MGRIKNRWGDRVIGRLEKRNGGMGRWGDWEIGRLEKTDWDNYGR